MYRGRFPVGGRRGQAGHVDNIARPGGNVTGSAGISGAQLFGKLLELLAAVVPGARLIGALGNSTSSGYDYGVQAARSAAAALGLGLQVFSVRGTDELEGAFAAMGAARVQALAMVHSTIFASASARPKLAELALKHGLASVTNDTELPAAGGLLGYGVNRPDVYRYSASYVDKILKGARPGDLPMERPSKFDLAVNLKTARSLGLTLPEQVLQQATEVIR
jgi:putative tryptophan/tyrosine transport system substrate-binding protein